MKVWRAVLLGIAVGAAAAELLSSVSPETKERLRSKAKGIAGKIKQILKPKPAPAEA